MSTNPVKSERNLVILGGHIVAVLFVFIHIPASNVIFLTSSSSGRSLSARLAAHDFDNSTPVRWMIRHMFFASVRSIRKISWAALQGRICSPPPPLLQGYSRG